MPNDHITIIYDGECPFCASYVGMMRLRDIVGTVDLVDARSDDPRVTAAQDAGLDLNEGMVVLWQDETFFGDDAVHLLATLTADDGGFLNKMQRWTFKSPKRAAWLYPLLTKGRRVVLRLMGRSLIADRSKKITQRRE